MGNTFFYQKVKTNADKITWGDIFSNSFKKHTKYDLERTLASGTFANSANEATMLAKWEKPWLWVPSLKIGLLLVLLAYAFFWIPYTLQGINGIVPAMIIIMGVIPPLVMPIVVMIFIWEMNIPKNISFLECMGYWIIGGILSLLITMLLSFLKDAIDVEGSMAAACWAPLTEEPAKLIASLIIIGIAGRKKKRYGITGLVIGACVGAGFGALESVQYALNNFFSYGFYSLINTPQAFEQVLSVMTQTQIVRAIGGIGGHTLYCAPYIAALTYNAYNRNHGKINLLCFASPEFLVTFGFSFLMHFLNNYNFSQNPVVSYGLYVLWVLLQWVMLLWILKRCLFQVVSAGQYYSGLSSNMVNMEQKRNAIQLSAISGMFNGRIWRQPPGGIIGIGRSVTSMVRFPDNAKGISRAHCMLFYRNGWMIQDMNSTYGTYVNRHRLTPGVPSPVSSSDVVQLGNSAQVFRITIM